MHSCNKNKNVAQFTFNYFSRPLLIFVNVKTLTMLLSFSEQAHGQPTWSLWATWCTRVHIYKM